MFNELVKDYPNHKLIYIEELGIFEYLFYFSDNEDLLYTNMIDKDLEWKNYHLTSSIFDLEVPLFDKEDKPIDLLIVRLTIKNSAGLKSLSNRLNSKEEKYLPLTLDELYLNFGMSLMGAFSENYKYVEFLQGDTIQETFNKIKTTVNIT